MRRLLKAVGCATILWTSNGASGANASVTDQQEHCVAPNVRVRVSTGDFLWKQALLQMSAANHAGKVVLFDGKVLRVFSPNKYGAPTSIRLEKGPSALAISGDGVIAWLESISNDENAPLAVHLLRGDKETASAPFERQRWKTPQTWPELYFLGEKLEISEQNGKLSEVEELQKPKVVVVVAPTTGDLTASLDQGGYFQYVWKSSGSGKRTSSSVTLYDDLRNLRAGRGIRTPIIDPVYAWASDRDRIIFLTENITRSAFGPWVHFINRADGREVRHLDYSNRYCWVTSFDVEKENRRAVILLNDGLIQIVDLDDAKVVDQITLPESAEYHASDQITSIGQNKFLVRTASGIALIDADK